jgi:hypothetical protein
MLGNRDHRSADSFDNYKIAIVTDISICRRYRFVINPAAFHFFAHNRRRGGSKRYRINHRKLELAITAIRQKLRVTAYQAFALAATPTGDRLENAYFNPLPRKYVSDSTGYERFTHTRICAGDKKTLCFWYIKFHL